ncbi:MAG: hypothetical protein H0U65_06645 [Rubrobacter sp.]|nr:hypothetical protein [Rubrobacter sp.]
MVESELPAPNSASEVSPELRSMDTSRAFAEGMPFPPIQSPPEGFAGSGSPTFIVQDTLPASVNFVSVRPVGPNADGVICSDPDAQRRIFCLYNPFSASDSESEELAQIKITVRTTKPGLIKNTARIGTGLIGLTSS